MSNNKIVQANISIHSKLLKIGDYQKSTHKSDRNRRRLKNLFAQTFSKHVKHLDVGCGDGFIFECTPENFESFGLDITPLMLEECGKRFPQVNLSEGLAEEMPYENEFFDFITVYSFLDHLENREKFYREAFRCLKKGGKAFFGLNPNQVFYSSFTNLV